jgi:phage baseplate assembly protein W
MSNKRPFLGRGLAYPLETNPAGDFKIDIDTVDTVRSSLIFLLHTRVGERPHRPETGSRLMDFKHELNGPEMRDALEDEIRDTITRNEPRIEELTVIVETSSRDEREVLISLKYKVVGENVQDNLVFPFYVGE